MMFLDKGFWSNNLMSIIKMHWTISKINKEYQWIVNIKVSWI